MESQEKKEDFSSFPHTTHRHTKYLSQCLSTCAACAKKCIQENKPETAILCSDCADICALTIKFHCGESEFSQQVMALCAQICQRCGEACGQSDSEHCKECSDICFKCAEACKET